ncbi:MAG: xanthine dehydrogenase family protein subunit M [Elusimicrobia bacterium]|jgi:CO/xanthine dehydrogenase FAD-binding subunit|nr:xanthine dehydrogenase family protein subunit M [Elusimicrobiota bacterium]
MKFDSSAYANYIIPDSVEDISRRLRGRVAYFLAGGTDIMALKKDGLLEDRIWVDISGLKELKEIKKEDDYIKIGALSTMSDIASSKIIREYAAALKDSADDMGSPLIRNLATIGGNLANSSPAGDTLPALCALDAIVKVTTAGNQREIPVFEFVTGPGSNVLNEGEIITSVDIPFYSGSMSGFLKLGSRRALAISKVSVAVWWVTEDDEAEEKKIKDISIFMGAVGPKPLRAKRTEELLKGETLMSGRPGITSEKFKEAKERIMTEAKPIDDFRSTAEYCSQMVGVLLERILVGK